MTKSKNGGGKIKLAIALVALAAALAFAGYSFLGGDDRPSGVYYLDLNTGKVFVGPGTALSPIETPSGLYKGEPAGVRTYIFSCKPCRGLAGLTLDEVRAKGAFPVWVEKYEAEAKKALEDGDNSPEVIMEGLLTMAPPPEGTKWLGPSSREARALRDTLNQLCPDRRATECKP